MVLYYTFHKEGLHKNKITMEFVPNQRVTVCKAYNQFNEGEQYIVATTNKIVGMYSVILKDAEGNVKGAIPQDFIQAN